MTLGLRDYVEKNGFPGVLIGLSGGVDSAITAAVAVDALGPDRVRCVMMPSPFTSQESLEDAAEAAKLWACILMTSVFSRRCLRLKRCSSRFSAMPRRM